MKELTLVEKVQEWHKDKGIDKGVPIIQFTKLVEEVAELGVSIVKDDIPEVIDALGDIQVVLLGLGLQMGLDLNTSLETAYNVIKDRTGENVNGLFVKSNDLVPVKKTNEELLSECISISHKINNFGNFIFTETIPTIKSIRFSIFEIEYDYEIGYTAKHTNVYINNENNGNYTNTDFNTYNKIKDVNDLHEYLTNILNEKEGK